MKTPPAERRWNSLPALFLAARLVLLVALPFDGLRTYGDWWNFHSLAGLGLPYLDLWVEFPPLFPFFSRLLYLASGGREHTYGYLLMLGLTLLDAANLALFLRLLRRLRPGVDPLGRAGLYFVLLLVLPYTWWYFDSLAVAWLLLGLLWLLDSRPLPAGLALGAGILTKLFPALLLPAAWLYLPRRKALTASLAALGLAALVYGGLYLASPELTAASLRAQLSKGSWETAWALLDGNLRTGNLGLEPAAHLDPGQVAALAGSAPVLPPWLTLLLFSALGLVLFWRTWRRGAALQPFGLVAFSGLTCCLFFLWSPGWSVQWALYLLPILLLILPQQQLTLFAFLWVLVNLLEWPLLLSRGLFWGLYLTIPLRTLLLALLAWSFWQAVQASTNQIPQEIEVPG